MRMKKICKSNDLYSLPNWSVATIEGVFKKLDVRSLVRWFVGSFGIYHV